MKIIDQIYNLRRNFVLVGLTGRTGSGCSMLASWMNKEKKVFCEELLNLIPEEDAHDNDSRKTYLVKSYICEKWTQFTIIKASDVIMYYALLLKDFYEFQTAITRVASIEKSSSQAESDLIKNVSSLKTSFEDLHKKAIQVDRLIENLDKEIDTEKLRLCINFLLEHVAKFREQLRNILGIKYISVFQQWGNSIRMYNSILEIDSKDDHSPSCLARKIKLFIKAKHRINKIDNVPTYIVIDALRNPYEILYFRERYASFYLISMNTKDDVRYENLEKKGYSYEIMSYIDRQEKEKKDIEKKFSEQDIDKCIELSDIHLAYEQFFNRDASGLDERSLNEKKLLIKQLITYIALIMHPGLVPPSPHERAMQIAYTAKLNSGCLSRQVGAVVTNTDFSIKSIGWNTVPKGQTPCSLRYLDALCEGNDSIAYSEYERKYPFSDTAKKLLNRYNTVSAKEKLGGLQLSYCFKDIHTASDEKQSHNQVHTRSLHAEENAFLQLAKYGTTGIDKGYLYTTASCCELCAKKAYQLGIKTIYYIDTYPGITRDHILAIGLENNRPQMKLFYGAVGRAYVSLFNPYIPLKDELFMRTGVDVKQNVSTNVKEAKF